MITRSLPLSLDALATLLARHGVNEEGRRLIERIRMGAPVRPVQGARGNVTGRYQSRKMGRSIQYESTKGEFVYIMGCETNPMVHEYYDQPADLTLDYTVPGKKRPRRVGVGHTPDFFEISENGSGFVECKLRKELEKLIAKGSERYVPDGDGFRSPPAEQAAAYYRLGYRVWTPCGVPPALTANSRFLEAEWGKSRKWFPDDVRTGIVERVRAKPAISLEELVHASGNPDAVHWCIFHQHVHVDLAEEFLAYADRVKIFTDPSAAAVWHAAIASVPHSQGPVLSSTDVLARSRLAHYPPEAGQVALERFKAIRDAIENDVPADQVRLRKHRRWLLAFRKAQRESGVGFVGLYPHTHSQGNRGTRIHPRTLDVMDEVACTEYETARNVTGKVAHAVLVGRCEEEGVPIVSYNTWMRFLHKRDQETLTRLRKGRRQAGADAPPVGPTGPAVHGQGPFDIVHIDHTKLDVFVRYGSGETHVLARPWVSIAFCAWSRCVVGYDVSFDSPATPGLFTTLRDVYVNHGRMPNAVVVDRGAEFGSTAFEELCAACSIQKIERPPGRPRFGSPGERFFHTLNLNFVHLLAGNTQLLKNPRQMSPEVDPARDAVWQLDEFDRELSRFLFEVYPAQPHRGLNNMPPEERFEQGRKLVGFGQALPPNSPEVHFLLWPPSKRGDAKVHFRTGIPVDNDSFWHPEMVDDGVRGTRVPVRVDPHDAGHVAAWIKGRWVLCQSAEFAFVQGLSKRELRLASGAIRAARKARGDSSKAAIRVRELAQFVREVRETEEGLREAIREDERRRILERRRLRLVTDSSEAGDSLSASPWDVPDFDSVDPGKNL